MTNTYFKTLFSLTICLFLSIAINQSLSAHDTYTDIDENVYHTESNGDRVWFSENLKVKTFNNVESISYAETDADLESNSIDILQPSYTFLKNESTKASLIENGDFETGDFTGWEVHADNALVQGADDMGDPSQLIDGAYSAYKNWGTGDIISQVVELEAGQEYTLSFEGFLAWDWIYLYARVFDTSNNEKIAETNVHKADSISATIDFVAPEDGSVEIRFNKWADSPGRVGIDNITLVEAETATSNESDMEQPKKIQLSQNYPNPFNPSTSISFTLPEASNITLSIHNMIGQEVAVLVDGRRTAGEHTIAFDASNLSSGIYMYRLKSGSTTITKKMTLMK